MRKCAKNQNQISQMGLTSIVQDATNRKLKAEYGFTEYPEALKIFYQVIDTSFLKNKEKWVMDHFSGMTSDLFTIGDTHYTQQDFARFILEKGQSRKRYNPYYFVTSLYKDFVDNMLQQYQKNHLEEKYPEFRYLMQEYHDGILLFDLTDKLVGLRPLLIRQAWKLSIKRIVRNTCGVNGLMWQFIPAKTVQRL
jgi:peptidyl-prolyl cis-trans isomerase SurA